MARKMLGVFTAVAAALLLVGVAWAGTDGAGEEPSSTEATAPTIPDEEPAVLATVDDGDSKTPSSIHDDDDEDTRTSSSIHDEDEGADTTSTSIHDEDDDEGADTTSTSIHDEDDDEKYQVFEDQRVVYDIPEVGRVTVGIVDGRLEVDVSAPDWDIEIESDEADHVEVKFRKGSDQVEFEAEIEDGKIKIEVELESS